MNATAKLCIVAVFIGLLSPGLILRDRAEKADAERAAAAAAAAYDQAKIDSDSAGTCQHLADVWQRRATQMQLELNDVYYNATSHVSSLSYDGRPQAAVNDPLIRHDTEYRDTCSNSNAYFLARAQTRLVEATQDRARAAAFDAKSQYNGDTLKAGIALAILCPALLILAWIIHNP